MHKLRRILSETSTTCIDSISSSVSMLVNMPSRIRLYKELKQMMLQSYSLGKNILIGPRQANLVLIDYASSEGSGEPAHPRSLARTFAARSYKQ